MVDVTIVFMGVISWFINQLITGGPHLCIYIMCIPYIHHGLGFRGAWLKTQGEKGHMDHTQAMLRLKGGEDLYGNDSGLLRMSYFWNVYIYIYTIMHYHV